MTFRFDYNSQGFILQWFRDVNKNATVGGIMVDPNNAGADALHVFVTFCVQLCQVKLKLRREAAMTAALVACLVAKLRSVNRPLTVAEIEHEMKIIAPLLAAGGGAVGVIAGGGTASYLGGGMIICACLPLAGAIGAGMITYKGYEWYISRHGQPTSLQFNFHPDIGNSGGSDGGELVKYSQSASDATIQRRRHAAYNAPNLGQFASYAFENVREAIDMVPRRLEGMRLGEALHSIMDLMGATLVMTADVQYRSARESKTLPDKMKKSQASSQQIAMVGLSSAVNLPSTVATDARNDPQDQHFFHSYSRSVHAGILYLSERAFLQACLAQ
jgi:hypothetical protein